MSRLGSDVAEPSISTRSSIRRSPPIHEAYARKVVDTLSDLDNVLYEISNENHPPSTEWQYHFIRLLKDYERTKAKQHPIGMTFQWKGGSNKTLFDSPADWISPNPEGGYRDDPPTADGRKVILTDTDHLWGIGGSATWVWKSFLRGMNPLFMDPYEGVVLGEKFDPKYEPVRNAMGVTLRVARELNLAAMTPRNELASSRYCLAGQGKRGMEYVVYVPKGEEVTRRSRGRQRQADRRVARSGERHEDVSRPSRRRRQTHLRITEARRRGALAAAVAQGRLTTLTENDQFYHGTGVGDINGDGRNDLILNEGWWEQPANGSDQSEWTAQPFRLPTRHLRAPTQRIREAVHFCASRQSGRACHTCALDSFRLSDIPASHGVIHVIDAVMPPN